MKPIILIKLGGSLLTDKTKPFTAREDTIKRIAQELSEATKDSHAMYILGNGAGSFGHVPAKEYCLLEGKTDAKSLYGVALTHNAATQLNLLVTTQLLHAGMPAVSLTPAGFITAENGKVISAYLDPLQAFAKLHLRPVIFGDVVSNGNGGYSVVSTDTIMTYIAKHIRIKEYKVTKLIHVGTTDGVYDGQKKTIPVITPKTFEEVKSSIGGSAGVDVTGGMMHKVTEALELVEQGIETFIVNGEKERELGRAVRGEKTGGTVLNNRLPR